LKSDGTEKDPKLREEDQTLSLSVIDDSKRLILVTYFVKIPLFFHFFLSIAASLRAFLYRLSHVRELFVRT